MKREIWCNDCDHPIHPYDGEGHKKVRGPLTKSVLCDACGKEVPAKTRAIAVSMFLDGGYFDWEDEFICTGDKNV